MDFTVFVEAYWPKIGSRHLNPGVVFAEFLGVIKGAGSPQNGYRPLSRDEYIRGCSNLAPAFSTQAEREQLYSMYERYETLKGQKHQHDSIDKVLTILSAICQPSMKRKLYDIIQEIYVDGMEFATPSAR